MGRHDKLLVRILRGHSDANISFAELCALLAHLGFDVRIRGSHRIFTRQGIDELITLQSAGAKAKVYQVRQVRAILQRYGIGTEGDEE